MGESSMGKWLLAIVVCVLLVLAFFYPHEVWFMTTFIWDIFVQNVRPLIQRFFPSFGH